MYIYIHIYIYMYIYIHIQCVGIYAILAKVLDHPLLMKF